MLGMITKSNPGGDGTPAETKAIFSKFIFIETRKEFWNIDKITSKGFTTGQNKQKKYKYKYIYIYITDWWSYQTFWSKCATASRKE